MSTSENLCSPGVGAYCGMSVHVNPAYQSKAWVCANCGQRAYSLLCSTKAKQVSAYGTHAAYMYTARETCTQHAFVILWDWCRWFRCFAGSPEPLEVAAEPALVLVSVAAVVDPELGGGRETPQGKEPQQQEPRSIR